MLVGDALHNVLDGVLVAAAFLAPGLRWLVGGARHGLLMAFCISTYAVAPVAGFGWLLAAMGLAQLESDGHRLRVAYVAVFSLIFIYAETPLVSWLFRLIAP